MLVIDEAIVAQGRLLKEGWVLGFLIGLQRIPHPVAHKVRRITTAENIFALFACYLEVWLK